MQTTITIFKEQKTKKDGGKYDKHYINIQNKRIQLGFLRDSGNYNVIPYGVSKIVVDHLTPANNSFYPKYYATFIECVKKGESDNELVVDEETGELITVAQFKKKQALKENA